MGLHAAVNQERSTGWGSRWVFGNNELPIAAAIGGPIWYLLTRLRGRSSSVRRHVDKGTVLAITCIMVPMTVILFFQAGKASLSRLALACGLKDLDAVHRALYSTVEHAVGLSDYCGAWARAGMT